MSYPTALDNFTRKTDDVSELLANDVNELQVAIEALESKVGITDSENFVKVTGDAMTGALTMTCDDTDNYVPLTITQNDTTNNLNAIKKVNAGTGIADYIDQNGNGIAFFADSAATSQPCGKFGTTASNREVLLLAATGSATGICLALSNDVNRAHIRMTGDPTVASPTDGDMWFDGTNLKFRNGATTYNVDMTAA